MGINITLYLIKEGKQAEAELCQAQVKLEVEMDVVQLGLGQSLTLKSLSTTTTHHHPPPPTTNFFKGSRPSRKLRFDM